MSAAFIDNSGVTLFRSTSAYSLAAGEALAPYGGTPHYHVRVGEFSVIVIGTNVIAARVYEADNEDHLILNRSNPFYAASVKDRLEVLDLVQGRLKTTHPYFCEMIAMINAERSLY